MTITDEKQSINKTARWAGFLYLLMMPFAIFTLYTRFSTFIRADATATAENIVAAEALIRAGVISWLIQQTISILLVLALYRLLKSVNRSHALLMVIFILLSIPISMFNELNQLAALLLLSGANYFSAFEPAQVNALVMLSLNLHEHGTVIVHLFWGLWLFPMGYLVFKSGFIPRILGILLVIAGVGYLMDMVTFIVDPDRTFIVTGFTFVGELFFPLWLLIKGIDVEQWERGVHQ